MAWLLFHMKWLCVCACGTGWAQWGMVHIPLCPYSTSDGLRERLSVTNRNSGFFKSQKKKLFGSRLSGLIYMVLYYHNGRSALQVCFSFTHYHTPSSRPTRSDLEWSVLLRDTSTRGQEEPPTLTLMDGLLHLLIHSRPQTYRSNDNSDEGN